MNQFYKNISLWLVIVLMMVMLYNIFNQQQQTGTMDIGYSEFLSMVEKDRVQNVVIQGQDLYFTDINDTRYKSFAPNDGELIQVLRANGVDIKA
ncbi:MAG: ATP-dependent metallopeptidase FtsH/Yme1/Tma family protein, partial [Desulfobacteraceae bacterium]|nr:ATP-dependent metallopeptidase FtsH/Yme1/Tma family protein [Desulfobacteraceae bacterium]